MNGYPPQADPTVMDQLTHPTATDGWPSRSNVSPQSSFGWPDPLRASPALKLLRSFPLFLDPRYSQPGEQFAVNQGTGGSVLNARYGSTLAADSNDPLWLPRPVAGRNYFATATTTGANFVSVPGTGTLDIAGDLAIAVEAELLTVNEDRPLLIKRESGVDGALIPFALGTWPTAGGSLKFSWTDPGGTLNTIYGTLGVPAGCRHFGVIHDVDNGAGGNAASFYTSTDGTNWTLLQTVTAAGVTSHRSNTAVVNVCGANAGIYGAVGNYFRARIWDTGSFAGAPVLDINTATDITDSAATTFTATTGQLVTVNRATSGRKLALVTRPVWLFGTDDYVEIPHHPLLDFGVGQAFTALVVVRQWATPASSGRWLHKGGGGSPNAGWALSSNGTALQPASYVGSGVSAMVNTGSVFTAGSIQVLGLMVGNDRRLRTIGNGTISTGGALGSLGPMNNTGPLRIGGDPAGGSYQDFELLGVALARHALTTTELATIRSHFGAV